MIGCADFLIPVILDQGFQVFAIGWCRVWDIMIREPALQFSLMPLVVC